MLRNNVLSVGVTVICGLTCNANPVCAEQILDQSFLGGSSSVSGSDAFAQTFTVGITGRLTGVSIPIFGDVDMTVDVRPTVAGVPLLSDAQADQLSRVTVTPPSFAFGLVSIDLTAFDVAVNAGDVLALVLRSAGVQSWLNATGSDATYPGGEAFLSGLQSGWRTHDLVFPDSGPSDFQFQTFVEPDAAVVPEPASMMLVGLGLAGLVARRWKQMQV